MIGIVTGRTIVVDDDGPADYSTIGDAIDDSNHGDIIKVFNGTYYENVRVNREISLIGNGSDDTIIDGGGEYNVVRMRRENAIISGFSVINSGEGDAGIVIEADNVTIKDNTISDCGYGIELREMNYCTIINNTCYSNTENGILVYDSGYNTIHTNNCNNNTRDGIGIHTASNNSILFNRCDNNSDSGISIRSDSMYNNVSGNSCSGNQYGGIEISSSEFVHCSSNNLAMNGIYIWGYRLEQWNTHTIESSNNVNGKQVFFWKNDSNLQISSDYGQIILANISNSRIENQKFENCTQGISIGFSLNVTIVNVTSDNNVHGIFIMYSSQINITNVTSVRNSNGIWIENSNNTHISETTSMHDRGNGIYLSTSRDNTIQNSTCNFNEASGIFIQSSNNNEVHNNNISNNYFGLHVESSENNIIYNNHIFNNFIGMQLTWYSKENIAYNNSFEKNTEFGINATDNEEIGVHAINNWWGHPSGPYHSILNQEGMGNEVTDNVDFSPWLFRPFDFKVNHVSPHGNDTTGNGTLQNPFFTIQRGIDECKDWDILRVYEGTYHENVIVNATVEIIGNGSDATTVDGGMAGPAFRLNGDGISISGFSITGGLGAGVQIQGNDVLVDHCTISSNDNGVNIGDTMEGIPIHEIWNATYGGSASDTLSYAAPTSDGGVIIAGNTASYGGSDTDVWLIKLDGQGKVEWDQVIEKSNNDRSCTVIQTSDGGYLMTGYTEINQSDIWVVKTDDEGTTEWEQTYGYFTGDRAYAGGIEAPDGGYVVGGYSGRGGGQADAYFMKINLTGGMVWEQFYGGSQTDVFWSFSPIPEGGYVLAGYTRSYGNGEEAFIVRTNAIGEVIWEKYYGGPGDDRAKSVIVLDDGFLVAGFYTTQQNGKDMWLFKLDADGNMIDSRFYGGADPDEATVLRSREDGTVFLLGTTSSYGSGNSDIWLVKVMENYAEAWNMTFGGSNDDIGMMVIPYAHDLHIFGRTKSYGAGDWDFWMLKHRTTADNVTISHCIISSNGKNGIHAVGSSHLTVIECAIHENLGTGVVIHDSDNVILESNILQNNGDTENGGGGNDNTSNGAAGLSMSRVFSSRLTNNTCSSHTGNTMVILNSTGSVIGYNRFTGTSSGTALFLENTQDIDLMENRIEKFDSGMVLKNSSTTMVLNSGFAHNILDIDLMLRSTCDLRNTTFETIDISDSNSSFTIRWYLDLKVTDNRSGFLPNSHVTIIDSFATPVFDGLTDGRGRIPQLEIMDFQQNFSSIIEHNPYTISIRKNGYLNFTEEITATSYTRVSSQLTSHILSVAIISGELIRHEDMDSFISFDGSDSTGRSITYFWEFGDDSSSTSPTPSHTYTIPGVYQVNLTVTDDYGNTSTTSIIVIVVNVDPTAQAETSTNSAFEDEEIQFDASTSWDTPSDIISFLWDFGDGTQTAYVSPIHVFQDEGNYEVSLTVMDMFGGESTTNIYISISNIEPWIVETNVDGMNYPGKPLHFTVMADDTAGDVPSLEYSWDFGDGTKAGGWNVTHVFLEAGIFDMKVTVTDDNGASDSTDIQITITDPEITTSVSSTSIFQDGSVIFNASHELDDGSFVYIWYFGDGTTALEQEASHIYSMAGIFTPRLMINDGTKNTTIFLQEIIVSNVVPIPVINVDTLLVTEDALITFNASESADSPSDQPILTYVWDFGDGSNGVGIEVTHLYSRQGVYQATMTVSDGKVTNTSQVEINVLNVCPTANAGPEKYRRAAVKTPIILDASASSGTVSDMPFLNYTWKIENESLYGKVVSYTFTSPGSFSVTLQVRDDDNCTSEDTILFLITKASEAKDEETMSALSWILVVIIVVFLAVIGFLIFSVRDEAFYREMKAEEQAEEAIEMEEVIEPIKEGAVTRPSSSKNGT